jgi:hypothetical protein
MAWSMILLQQIQYSGGIVSKYNSKYAYEAINGISKTRKNVNLLLWAQQQCIRLTLQARRVQWSWVKGHSSVHGNDMADLMAGYGSHGNAILWQLDDQYTMQRHTTNFNKRSSLDRNDDWSDSEEPRHKARRQGLLVRTGPLSD